MDDLKSLLALNQFSEMEDVGAPRNWKDTDLSRQTEHEELETTLGVSPAGSIYALK